MQEIKTKILATLGPSSSNYETIEKLIIAGVDGFRLNFSHGNEKEFDKIIKSVKRARKKFNQPICLLGDLQGQKIRVGKIENSQVEIKSGQTIIIKNNNAIGNANFFSASYKNLYRDLKAGDKILIEDGLIRLRVKKIINKLVYCIIEVGGILKQGKGLSLPSVKLNVKSLTKKDLFYIKFCIDNGVDFIALSFVRNAKDVIDLKNIFKKIGNSLPLIAKIELKEAVNNFESILKVSDGIMIARGDLGVEVEPQKVPIIQKKIINKCNQERKLVITATQMLESMIYNITPTRAEASDVANAVFDGTDTVMLSGETSIGKYPVQTVEMMNKILQQAEKNYSLFKINPEENYKRAINTIDAICQGVVSIANQINPRAIVSITHSGYTAIVLSKHKPNTPIFAMTESDKTCRVLNLYRGINAFKLNKIGNIESTINRAKALLVKKKKVSLGDKLIFVGSLTTKSKSIANLIKIEII